VVRDDWALFKLRPADESVRQYFGDELTVTGVIPNIAANQLVEVEGDFQEYKGKMTFKARRIAPTLPSATDDLEKFLTTLPNLSHQRAKVIVDRLGENALEHILREPNALVGIPGLTPDRQKEIREAIRQQWGHIETERELVALGFGPKTRAKIAEHFGAELDNILVDDPYRLLELSGITFHALDKKLLGTGRVQPGDKRRLSALVAHCLYINEAEGHTWLNLETLHQIMATQNPGITREMADKGIETALELGLIVEIDGQDGYTSPALAEAEYNIAKTLCSLLSKDAKLGKPFLSQDLTPEQGEAIKTAFSHPVSIITGGPGCGKTYVLKALAQQLISHGESVVICAPTGKAAKRVTESTGMPAMTIHRMLRSMHGLFAENSNKVCLIVEESSMVSAKLLHELFKLTRAGLPDSNVSRIVFVGDVDQLPSIEAGRVLDDMIANGIPTTRLTVVQRQKEASRIVANASQIRNGQPLLPNTPGSDFGTTIVHSASAALQKIDHAFSTWIPTKRKKDGKPFDLVNDIQVIAPTRQMCAQINAMLQAKLNPPSPDKKESPLPNIENLHYRQGDKVIITKNMPEFNVVNGDVGIVRQVGSTMEIEIDGEPRYLPELAQQHVRHAYAITVHKSQGSEAPFIIAVFAAVPPPMRQRSLLYTAVTRGKEAVWVIGDSASIQQCIKTNPPVNRRTRLGSLLRNPNTVSSGVAF
jgi:exodeoxyribonuclease V alpha subunit